MSNYYKSFFKFPWFTLLLTGIGVGFCTYVSVQHKNDLLILVGVEIIILSFGSLLVNNHLKLLVRGLLFIGVIFPFILASLTPLYFDEYAWFLSVGFWWMFGLGIIPGIVIFFTGIFVYTELERKTEKIAVPLWIGWIDVALKGWSVWTLLVYGFKWSESWLLITTFLGIILFCIGLLIVLPYRLN